MTEDNSKPDDLSNLKIRRETIDGKKTIVIEDSCSKYHQDDDGNIISSLKEDSPCSSIFQIARQITDADDSEDDDF